MLGTVQNLTDATATISDKNLFEAFGVKRGATGTTATPFGYVGGLGYYHDQDLSMPLLSIRHYQPRTGLFVSGDPDHRLPSYQLVAQLPTSFTDPSGMGSWGGGGEWVLLIGGGIRTLWCEDGGKRCLHWFLKVCIGGSAGVDAGYTANVNDCAEYEGWFLEGGAGWPTSLVGAVAPWSWPPWKWPLEAGIGLGAPASLAGCCYVDLNKCTPLTLGSVTTRFDNVCLGGAIGSLLQLTVGRFADEFDRWIQGQMDSWQSGWGMPYQ
jgi:RHS repeat-associated protein